MEEFIRICEAITKQAQSLTASLKELKNDLEVLCNGRCGN